MAQTVQESGYLRRIVDAELDELMPALPAIALEGAKGVGKTATARRRATTEFNLDDADTREVLAADLGLGLASPPPILLDEWQNLPFVWDAVRRSVDAGAEAGSYLLTGSARLRPGILVHSGAGRIVNLRMRPLSLAERALCEPTVSLASMFEGPAQVSGACGLGLRDYVREILSSGFPGIRRFTGRALKAQLESYVTQLVQREIVDQGLAVRRPTAIRAWLSAYAAATGSTASYSKILEAATPAEGDKPARSTSEAYREVLSQLWLLDPVEPWLIGRDDLRRLGQAPKHYLADPALAAHLLNVDETDLYQGSKVSVVGPQSGSLLGRLFENLVGLSLKTYAQTIGASLGHLRTHNGSQEIDFIVFRGDHRVVAIEVKLASTVEDEDVRHLLWLKERLGDSLKEVAVVTTGKHAYRRSDGVAVVPAGLLGP